MLEFLNKLISDENNIVSSKRVIGLLAGLGIILYAFIFPSDNSNNSMLILALGGLGLSSIEKIFKAK